MSEQSALAEHDFQLKADLYESGYRPLPVEDGPKRKYWEKPMGYSILSYESCKGRWTHYSYDEKGERVIHSTSEFDLEKYYEWEDGSGLADWLAKVEHELYQPVAAEPDGYKKNCSFLLRYDSRNRVYDYIFYHQHGKCEKCNEKLAEIDHRYKCANPRCPLPSALRKLPQVEEFEKLVKDRPLPNFRIGVACHFERGLEPVHDARTWWIMAVARKYHFIGLWLADEGVQYCTAPRRFEDPALGQYDSHVMYLKVCEVEAKIEPIYDTPPAVPRLLISLVSNPDRTITIESEKRGDWSDWHFSGGEHCYKGEFFEELIKLFGLRGE